MVGAGAEALASATAWARSRGAQSLLSQGDRHLFKEEKQAATPKWCKTTTTTTTRMTSYYRRMKAGGGGSSFGPTSLPEIPRRCEEGEEEQGSGAYTHRSMLPSCDRLNTSHHPHTPAEPAPMDIDDDPDPRVGCVYIHTYTYVHVHTHIHTCPHSHTPNHPHPTQTTPGVKATGLVVTNALSNSVHSLVIVRRPRVRRHVGLPRLCRHLDGRGLR